MVARAPQRIDIFVRGNNNTLRQWPGEWHNLAENWWVPSTIPNAFLL